MKHLALHSLCNARLNEVFFKHGAADPRADDAAHKGSYVDDGHMGVGDKFSSA